MAIGPVQLLVLGFNHPDFHGEVIAELERLRESDTVRVIDAMAVYKDAGGELEVEHLSNLTEQEAVELGTKIGALIGLGIAGEEGAVAGARPAARSRRPRASTSSATSTNGTYSRTSLTIPRQRSSCWNTTGPCRCGTPFPGRAASASATASSARSISWRSGS